MTQASDSTEQTRPTYLPSDPEKRVSWAEPPPKSRRGITCLAIVGAVALLLVALVLGYFMFPGQTNILIMGLDAREPESTLGRSDTLILSTVQPRRPYIGMLSIPRDLWVNIPNYGQNRINAAYFLAEADQPGSGVQTTLETVEKNFSVDIDYYVILRFLGFLELVDALGGVEVELPRSMSGYSAGVHHLDGDSALALVRDRANSDDFSRMERGQIFIKAIFKRLTAPSALSRRAEIIETLPKFVITNVPPRAWPRLAVAFLRVGAENIDFEAINREMVTPFTTDAGAEVLSPNWNQINPVLLEMFGPND